MKCRRANLVHEEPQCEMDAQCLPTHRRVDSFVGRCIIVNQRDQSATLLQVPEASVVIHADTSCLGLSVTRRAWFIESSRQDDGVSRSPDAEPSVVRCGPWSEYVSMEPRDPQVPQRLLVRPKTNKIERHRHDTPLIRLELLAGCTENDSVA